MAADSDCAVVARISLSDDELERLIAVGTDAAMAMLPMLAGLPGDAPILGYDGADRGAWVSRAC